MARTKHCVRRALPPNRLTAPSPGTSLVPSTDGLLAQASTTSVPGDSDASVTIEHERSPSYASDALPKRPTSPIPSQYVEIAFETRSYTSPTASSTSAAYVEEKSDRALINTTPGGLLTPQTASDSDTSKPRNRQQPHSVDSKTPADFDNSIGSDDQTRHGSLSHRASASPEKRRPTACPQDSSSEALVLPKRRRASSSRELSPDTPVIPKKRVIWASFPWLPHETQGSLPPARDAANGRRKVKNPYLPREIQENPPPAQSAVIERRKAKKSYLGREPQVEESLLPAHDAADGRRKAKKLEWEIQKEHQSRMEAMATSGWSDDLPPGWESLPPAPGEANERRRAKKYESEIQQEYHIRTRALITSARGNKLPADWSNSALFMLPDRKQHVASASAQKDSFVSHVSQLSHDHQQKRLSLSPVLQINDGGVLRPIFPIRLEDRLNPEPTYHRIGMPKTPGLHPVLGLTGIDEFIPPLSVQGQMRGVDTSRIPDPFPKLPMRRFMKKYNGGPRVASQTKPLRAPEHQRSERLRAMRRANEPVDELTATAMNTVFDFEAATRS
jgi:hypothetical protein